MSQYVSMVDDTVWPKLDVNFFFTVNFYGTTLWCGFSSVNALIKRLNGMQSACIGMHEEFFLVLILEAVV